MAQQSAFVASNVECLNLAKSKNPISTGVGFLDHMVDQFNSHAQIGVALSVSLATNGHAGSNENRFAESDQSQLLPLVGTELGKKFLEILESKSIPVGAESRFCCPLDEALIECRLKRCHGSGSLVGFTLAPYGIYPRGIGRSKIGSMQTEHVKGFLQALAKNAGLELGIYKIRGDNGHHIVESSFKALSRALRNLLDGTNTNEYKSDAFLEQWGPDSVSHRESIALQRSAMVERKTKETRIMVKLEFDGGKGGVSVETGLPTLNELYTAMAKEANVSLTMECNGDLWIDDHHTSEDVSIALGQVLTQAFGTKAGLNRMWCAQAQYGEASVEVVMDLSNRPDLNHNLSISDDEYVVPGEALTVEMFAHALESLVVNARMTAHIVEKAKGKTVLETAMAAFVAFGRALHMCAAVDPRRAGKTASSKGTLSV